MNEDRSCEKVVNDFIIQNNDEKLSVNTSLLCGTTSLYVRLVCLVTFCFLFSVLVVDNNERRVKTSITLFCHVF